MNPFSWHILFCIISSKFLPSMCFYISMTFVCKSLNNRSLLKIHVKVWLIRACWSNQCFIKTDEHSKDKQNVVIVTHNLSLRLRKIGHDHQNVSRKVWKILFLVKIISSSDKSLSHIARGVGICVAFIDYRWHYYTE